LPRNSGHYRESPFPPVAAQRAEGNHRRSSLYRHANGCPRALPAQAPAKCKLNQAITDVHGNHGVIFGGHDDLCLIKYKDGQTQRWVALKNLNNDRADGDASITMECSPDQ
jgi:hypothetical protein